VESIYCLTVFDSLTLCGADGWAVFDTVIVTISVAMLGSGGSNSWIKQLRVIRAFRLVQLLGKVSDLKQLVSAVATSILPTLQALVSDHHSIAPLWVFLAQHICPPLFIIFILSVTTNVLSTSLCFAVSSDVVFMCMLCCAAHRPDFCFHLCHLWAAVLCTPC
jgi:hypothetical protein